MADYEHDIFISYRRSDADWVRWTRDNFARALSSLLRPRLGGMSVFLDETIDDGAPWPNHLAMSLSRSKVMVAVLSRGYFQSEWCRLELALMHEREKSGNLRCAANPWGVIVPVTIDDGNCFPAEVQAMQSEPLHCFANPFMRPDSESQEKMAEQMRTKLCDSIETAMGKVPPYNPSWETIAHEQFEGAFKIKMESQVTLPSLSLPIV
ncbi:toll/interleukin-1 receptor domain-containing protein [Aliiroseovarius sp. F20344]|uniref:toll/interleukin-1 receptor domain-containing protein n=1 Tax=Aliiroseovarius sp. F20344 TaxID=2926414 RepID=UPI001FF58087|nr:toll/interleukin-1 receptor domain-containing protein [Aliiroseovarius sp. F20344]MCK0143007.1 toll/interleukin-1 receptor domain-containing protein [Aliiroseovarius sp. F20344]